jgi:hypothetical protein
VGVEVLHGAVLLERLLVAHLFKIFHVISVHYPTHNILPFVPELFYAGLLTPICIVCIP